MTRLGGRLGPMKPPLSGGCQCGAVRFSIEALGRASICHCRMCQKAFSNAFAPLVTAKGLAWTRGAPRYFQSSNKVRRGFCAACGTPLTYEPAGSVEVAVGALDDPSVAPPAIQVCAEGALPWFESLPALPRRLVSGEAEFLRGIVSHQHPDHDTSSWPPPEPYPET